MNGSETTAANVWAMGDCAGTPQFTHAAYNDFRVVHDNLNGGNRTTKDRLIPFCMFTDPELARVGRNETEAKRDKIDYRIAKLPMANVLRTHTIAEPRGFMKMLIGKEQRRNPGIHRVRCRGERVDGRRSDRDGRAHAIYRLARRDFHPSDDFRRAGFPSRRG